MTRNRPFAAFIAALTIAGVAPLSAAAQSLTPIRFTLDFKHQGIHAWYYVAQEKGYFKAEGLDVTIDQGEGSAATITRIMSGAYDAGFGDMNAIIQMAATKPGEAPVMVYQIYNRPPFVLVTKASGPIKTIKDIEGKKLGGPAGSATLRLFAEPRQGQQPRHLQDRHHEHGAEPSGADADPATRSQGSLVFNVTSYMNLIQQKQDPDKDYPLVQLRRSRPRSVFQRHHGVAEAAEGEPEGGRRAGARHQQGDQGRDRQSGRRRRRRSPRSSR